MGSYPRVKIVGNITPRLANGLRECLEVYNPSYDAGILPQKSWGSFLGISVGNRMDWDVLHYAMSYIARHRVEDVFSPMRWLGVWVSNRTFPIVIDIRWECPIGPSSLSFQVDSKLSNVVSGWYVLPNVNLFDVSWVVALGSPLVVIVGGGSGSLMNKWW